MGFTLPAERCKVDAAKARRSVGQGVNGADIQAVTDELSAVLTNKQCVQTPVYSHDCRAGTGRPSAARSTTTRTIPSGNMEST